MANNKNDKDSSVDGNLPTASVLEFLEQLLAQRFGNQDEKKWNYELHIATEKGDNYLGVVYRILVYMNELKLSTQSKAKENEKQKIFSLIIKVPPQNPSRRKQFFTRPCFIREFMAYQEFLPMIAAFQRERGIKVEKDAFSEYPECYDCLTSEYNEAIFLEDLCVREFRLFDRFAEMGRPHVALVMRTYAKLHAISFALKEQQPEKLQPFQAMVDIFKQRKDDEQLNAYFEQLKVNALQSFDANANTDDANYVARLKAYFARGSIFELLLALLDGDAAEPYAVVCHGDCWNNNIMFQHDEATGEPVRARLIDWQIMRYSSPITDLMYFMYTCTTKRFRDEHFDDMLNVYYTELSAHLKRLGSDHNIVFPRFAFDAEIQRKSAVGLLLAMMVLPIITMKSADAPDLEELSERIETGATTDLEGAGFLSAGNAAEYKSRMRGVVMDCVDRAYI